MPTHSAVLLGLLLLAIAVAGEAMTIHLRTTRWSGSLAALVLAMALLGPLPAAAIAVASVLIDDVLRRRDLRGLLWNAATYAVVPLVGAGLFSLGHPDDPVKFAAEVVLVFLIANTLNFFLVAVHLHLRDVLSLPEAFRTVYWTMLPFDLATALLTAGVAF